MLLLLERLNVKHLIMLRKITFYKRLLYSSDVFIHNMFCNCDDGILFKSVFYRKCDAIHSVWSAFQDYVLYQYAFFVILLLCVLLFRVYIVCPLSVLLPVLANKDVHKK